SALVIGGGVLLILSLVHLKQTVVVFDAPFAQLAGIKLNIIRALGFIALVATTVIGVKVVGVVLMVAVVIAPAIAARQWTNRLLPFIFCASLIGGVSAAIGSYLSIAAGNTAIGAIPTGPAIVLVQALIAAGSLIIAKVRAYQCLLHSVPVYWLSPRLWPALSQVYSWCSNAIRCLSMASGTQFFRASPSAIFLLPISILPGCCLPRRSVDCWWHC